MALGRPLVFAPHGGRQELAERVAEALGDAELRLNARREDVGAAFLADRPLIGLCAAGIAVRMLASRLADKRDEPPVLVVGGDDDAPDVIPLLGGHRGGNRLAAVLADALNGRPAVSTAGDGRFGIALDQPPDGWSAQSPDGFRFLRARMLENQAARIVDETGLLNAPDGEWLRKAQLPLADDAELEIRLVERPLEATERRGLYRPRRIALGAGCARGCPPDELVELAQRALAEADIDPENLAVVGSIDLKADETAIRVLGERFGRPVRYLSARELSAATPRLRNPSEAVAAAVGVAGVAEGACLLLADQPHAPAQLIVDKRTSTNATVALARAQAPINLAAHDAVGRPRGRLRIIGLGPGDPRMRSEEATRALLAADEWIGYRAYLDDAEDLSRGKRLHPFALGEEEARARFALERAAQGVDAALLCSGDPGIYAMAALVEELRDDDSPLDPISDAAKRAEIETCCGITAMCAAAARIGAPLGHDFCAVSLSDLLTPRDEIRKRIQAAADGDFVVALYNPRSESRKDLLAEALNALRRRRPPSTPAAVVADATRPDERIILTDLANLNPDHVDMRSIVLVGASSSRRNGERFYTPRGYRPK